jgi:hypothetical protein
MREVISEGLKCGEQVGSSMKQFFGFHSLVSSTKLRLDSFHFHHGATQFVVVWLPRGDSYWEQSCGALPNAT